MPQLTIQIPDSLLEKLRKQVEIYDVPVDELKTGENRYERLSNGQQCYRKTLC